LSTGGKHDGRGPRQQKRTEPAREGNTTAAALDNKSEWSR
jgi:hypothetical protein